MAEVNEELNVESTNNLDQNPPVKTQEGFPVTASGKVEVPKSNVDYFGLKFYGNNDRDVKRMQISDPAMNLTMMPKEQAFNHYKADAEKNGLEWDPGKFSTMYDQAAGQFVDYKKGMFDVGVDYDQTFNRRHTSFHAEAISPFKYDDKSTAYDLFPEEDTRFVMNNNEVTRVKSDEAFITEDLKWYKPITGEGDLSAEFMYGKDAVKNRTYKEIEIGGRKMRVGDLEADYSKFFGANKLTSGPEGETGLAIRYDEKGLPYAEEVSLFEKVEGDAIMSMWGPRKMRQSWYENLWDATITNTIAKLPAASVGFVDWLDDTADYMDANWFGDKTAQIDDDIDNADTFYRNLGNFQAVKTPENIRNAGFSDNAQAFWWSAGSALGSVAQMIITRKATGAFGKIFGMSDEAANTFGAYMGSGTMAITAADGFKQSMIEAGISEDAQLLLYAPALAGSFLVERMGSNILDDGLQKFYAKGNIKEYVDQSIKQSVKDFGLGSASQMSKEQASATGKKIWMGILEQGKSLGGKAIDLSKRGMATVDRYAPVSVKAAWEEGTEEVLEGRIYSSIESLHDMYQNSTKQDGRNLERYSYTQEGENFYEVDQVTSQKRKVSQATYDKLSAGQELKAGQGLFAEYNPELGFASNWATHASKDIMSDFVLGAFAGGIVGGASNILGGKDAQKEKLLQDYAINGKGEMMRKEFAKMHSNGYFGPTDISSDNQIIDPSNPEKVSSLNDVGYEAALKELEEAEQTSRLMGITDGKLLKELMESNSGNGILSEAYENVSKQRELQSQIKDIESGLEGVDDAQLIANAKEEIADITRQKEDLNLQLGDIRSGQRLRENVSNNAIKEWSKNNNISMVDPNGVKFTPGVEQVKNANDRYDVKKEERVSQLNESKQKRSKLENDVSSFASETVNPNAIDQTVLFEQISDIQKKASEVGLSTAGTKAMMGKLEGMRSDILESLDASFSASEIDEATSNAEITGEDVNETLLQMASAKPLDSDASKSYKLYNNLSNSIKSFDIEKKGDVKVGDMVQWTSGQTSNFDKPRKLESISEDGEFGFVEGSDTGIPIQELHDPTFEGERVIGNIPTEFDEQAFKSSFYDTYVDTQGNEISITATMADLASRKMNSEDIRTVELLDQAIKNNSYLAAVNSKVIGPLSKDKKFDLGKYKPSSDSLLSESDHEFIQRDLSDKKQLLNLLKIKQQVESNDKKNREGKLRFNEYQMRNDIVGIITNVEHVSLENRNKLVNINTSILEIINSVKEDYSNTKTYNRGILDTIDPLLVEAESIIHTELRGENSDKIVRGATLEFKQYKGYGTKKARVYHNADEFVMQDFDDTFDYESFSAKDGSDAAGSGQAKTSKAQFSNVYFTNYLQTLFRLPPNTFYDYYGDAISNLDVESGQVPSYEQIRSIYSTSAFMINSSNKIFWDVQDVLTGAENKSSKEMNFNHGLFVRGFAGTGKTSLVVKYATEIYSNMLGRDLSIDTSAPSTELQRALNSSINSVRDNSSNSGMTFDELIAYASNKDSGIAKTDLIIVDEASNLSKHQLLDLKNALNKVGTKASLSIIFLGDQSQMTSVNQQEGELVAIERVMERTMPTTEVFRSGAADISNLQSAYRNAIFGRKEAILPKGTYDKEKNNGLHYFNGTKKEMYDSFVADLNSEDSFKKNNTILIVYTKADREAAINYVRKFMNDSNVDLGLKVKTIEEGEYSAQGLEYGRIHVAIDQTDAKHLYNPAMLTAITRAKKIDEEHNGFTSVLSTNGFSEEGTPIIVETKTASQEDINRHKSWIASITGKSLDPDKNLQKETSSSIKDVTIDDFNSLKANMDSIVKKGKIEFTEGGFEVDGLSYRYKIKNKAVSSVTQKLTSVTQEAVGQKKQILDPHAKRGNAIHKILQCHLLKQQKRGGKLFTKEDVSEIKKYVGNYNSQVDAWNETASKTSQLETISLDTDEAIFDTNEFVQNIIANIAIPIAERLNQGGKFSLPESVIGIYFNEIAGTIDIVDHVGMDGGIPVVDIYDLKTLTPGSARYFGDTDLKVESSSKIVSPNGQTYAGTGLNKALSQLGTYKAIYENGDSETGFMPVKVRNAVIIKASISGANSVSELSSNDFVSYDTESSDFKKFKDYGSSTVDKGVILQEKNKKTYDKTNEKLESVFTDQEGNSFEVTGMYTDVSGNEFVELNNDLENPITIEEYDSRVQASLGKKEIEDPTNQTFEFLYKKSAVNFEQGNSFSFGTASSSVDNGKPGYSNDHFRFKTEFFKAIKNSFNPSSPSISEVDLVFHPEMKLLNDKGELETFKNVIVSHISEDLMQEAVAVAKKMSWAEGLNVNQIAKEIKSKGYDIISTLPNPDSDFGKVERDIDYTSEIDVQKLMERIKAGFISGKTADPFKTELVNWHTHLAALRVLGAKNPGQPFASVAIKNVSAGSVAYDGKQKALKGFVTGSESKGFVFGQPYFASKMYTKKDSNGRVSNIASWAIDAWRVSPNVDKSTVILRTAEFNANHAAELKNSINELRSNKLTSPKDINSSLAMSFLRQNRTFLIDFNTKDITTDLPGLSEFLSVDKFDIDINVSGKRTVPTMIDSLAKAIDLLEATRKDGNKISMNLREAVPFVIGDKNMRVIPAGMESKLFTSALEIRSFGVTLNTRSIDTSSITKVSNGVVPATTGRRPMGSISDDVKTDSGKLFMIEENDGLLTPDSQSDFNLEPKPILAKDGSFYAFASKYFGDLQLMNKVKKDVSKNLILESNWNRDLTAPIATTSQMIENTWRFYSEWSKDIESANSSIDVSSDSNTYTDLSEISGETVHLLNSEQLNRYFYYVVGKDSELFMSIVDNILPNLNLKKEAKKDLGSAILDRLNSISSIEDAVESKEENDVDVTISNENSQGSVMDSLDSRPITDTLSEIVKLHVSHVELKNYIFDNISGKTTVSPTGQFISTPVIHKSLMDAAQMSHWPDINSEQIGMDKIQRWAANLMNIAYESGTGSPTYNNIMSFYDVFFSEDKSLMSHKFLRDNSMTINGMNSLIQDMFNYDPEVIKSKGESSDNLLSSLYAHFLSVASKKNISIELKGSYKNPSFKQKTQSLAIGSHIAQSIKQRINNNLFSLSEDGLVVDQDIVDKLTKGSKQQYNVTSDGVYDLTVGKSKKLVSFKSQDGRIVEYGIPQDVMPQELKDVLNVLGIKELVYTSVIKSYLSNAKDSNPDPEKRRDREKIAEIVGMTMLTTRSAVDPLFSANQLVDSYYKENGYSMDSLDELNDDSTFETEGVGSDIKKPSDLWRLFENLAKTQSDIQLQNHSRHMYDVKGNKVYRDTNGSTIHQMFTTGDNSGILPSSGIKKYFQNVVLSNENASKAIFNPLIGTNGEILNKIAASDSGWDMTDMFIMDGTKGSYKSVKQGGDMTDLDFSEFLINGLFINDVLSGNKLQKIKLPFHLTSNKSSLPVMEYYFGGNQFSGNENEIKINENFKIENVLDIFRYHNNARITSYNRWGAFLRSLGYDINIELYNKFIEDPENFNRYLDLVQKAETEKGNDFADSVRRTKDLTSIKDYSISKGIVNPGQGTSMNVDNIYNWRNFNRLNNVISQENNEKGSQGLVSSTIDSMFFQRHMDSAKRLGEVGFKLDKRLNNQKLYSLAGKNAKGSNIWKVNPTLEAYFYAFHFADHNVSQLVMGDVTQYKDISDVIKRSSMAVAPGWAPDTSSPRGIGKKSKAVLLEDIEGEVYEQLQSIFGHDGSNTETDGLGIINPIMLHIMKNSYGGNELGVVGEGMIKPVYGHNDLLTNDAVYFKYSLLPMTQQVLENSQLARETFMKMTSPEIYKMWEDGMSIEDLAEYVLDNQLQGDLIMQSVFTSGNKTGNKAVQNFNDLIWETSVEVDNEYFRIQLNPEQDITKTNISTPTQLGGVVGSGTQNAQRVSELNQLKADIAIESIESMSKKFIQKGTFDSELFKGFLKDLGIKSAEKIGEITKFAEMLTDPEIDVNIPTQRLKLVQQFMNKITSDAIKPQWNGVRMSQAPAFFFDIFEDEEGNIYMENENKKYGMDASVKRKLQPMKFYSDPEFKNEITSREEFEQLKSSGDVFLKPGEVIVPFSYFEQFGIKEFIDKDPSFSLNDVFMLETQDGNLVNLKNLLTKKDPEISAKVEELIKQSFQGSNADKTTFLQQKFTSATQAISFLENFRESLKVLPNRIPTSSSSFGWPGEIVGWINDNGNTVFTSSQKNILDGGDYDIDQLNIYFKNVNNEGKIVVGESKEGKINQMFDLVLDYYNDPSNADLFMKRLSLRTLEQQVSRIKENQTSFKGTHNDFGTNLYYYDNIKQGDALIGIFANIVKTYSYLSHVSNIRKDITTKIQIDPEGLNSIGDYIANVLERFLNAAMDNVKESILGYLGATEDAGNIIGAAAIMKMDEVEISNFLQNDVVSNVFKFIKYSKRVNGKTVPLLDAINHKIDDISNQDSAELRYSLQEELDNVKLQLAGNIDDIPVANTYLDEYGRELPLKGNEVRSIQENIYNAWLVEEKRISDALSNTDEFDLLKQNNLDVLNRLKDMAYLGESIRRLNTVTKIDSQGIPVFDYKIDKLIRDIEFNIGMPLDDFLSGGTPDKEWYKSKKSYLSTEDKVKFDEQEEAIRDYINIGNVVKELPHIMAYLNALQKAKYFMSQSFIRNSKMSNQLADTFNSLMKNDWFKSEQAYYSFYKEMDKFFIATYFATDIKQKKHQTITGVDGKILSIDVSTAEGRGQFGFEFPTWAINYRNEIAAKPESDLSKRDLEIKENRFLNSLTVNVTPSGSFLEFTDSYKLTEDDYRDLRASFKTLPQKIKEKFHMYQLSKDGFTFTKGALYEAMDNEMFRDYSKFLSKIQISANGKTNLLNFDDGKGNIIKKDVNELLNDSFLKDVGFYSDDMNLLSWNNDKWEQHQIPEQSKEREQTGSFFVQKVKQKNVTKLLQGSTKRTFNGYNPLRSNLTTEDVLRKVSDSTYRSLKNGSSAKIKFSGKTSFSRGQVLRIFDGSAVKISAIDGNVITVVPIVSTDPYRIYQSHTSKISVLESIVLNSENEMHRILAQYTLDAISASKLKDGVVDFTNEDSNETFHTENVENGNNVLAYSEASGVIAMNMDRIQDAEKLEKVFLHELTHDYTSEAFNLEQSKLDKLGEQGKRIAQFQQDIKSIYNQAKEAAKGNPELEKQYGLKNENEFMAEAKSNPNFQKFLMSVEPVTSVEDPIAVYGEKNLYQRLLSSIKRLLGVSDKDAPNTLLDQAINIIGNFVSNGDYMFDVPSSSTGKQYYAESGNEVNQVNETKEIIGSLQPSSFSRTYSQLKEDQLINDIFSSIDVKTKSYYYNGEKFHFKGNDGEMMDEISAKSKIKNDILPLFTEFENNYKNSVIGWLNNGAQIDGSLPGTYFPKKGGESRYNANVLAEMRRLVDHDVNDFYMRYSELKNNPEFANIPHIQEFEGYDPIVVVHKSIDGENMSISLFDATSLRLSKKGFHEGNIFKKYITNDYEARDMGINLGNNEGDIRKLLLGLQVMAMKKANPGLKIKHIGVLGVGSKSVDSTWVYMSEFTDNIKAMRSIDQFKNSLSQPIQDVMNDDSVYKDDYDQPWIFMLKRKFQEKAQDLTDIDGQEYNLKKTNDAVSQIESYLNGEGSKDQTLQMMISRMEQLQNKFNENDLMNDTEYIYLSNTVKEMSSIKSFEKNGTKDLDRIKSFFSPVPDISHDIINWAQEKILSAMNTVQEKVRTFQTDEFVPLLKTFNERYFQRHPEQRTMDYLQDLSGKKFLPLFKTRTVKDMDGNDVEINSLEIHWDINDDETKAALSKGTISQKDVELGKFIVDTFEKQMIENLLHLNRHAKGYKKEDAQTELSLKWRKGMIPAMSSSVNEMLMKKDPKNAKAGLKKFFNQISNMDDIYDELDKKKVKDTKRQRILKEMSDFFMHQIGRDSETFGSNSRMGLMGLKNDVVGTILIDSELNKNLSTNLEMIVLYMVSSSERKRLFDRKVLPYVNAAQTMLQNPELSKLEGDQEISKSYFQNYINSTIKGMPDTLDSKILGVDVDAAITTTVQLASFNGLALNVPVALTSGLMNAGQFMNTAIANDMAVNGLFGKSDARKAIQMFGTKQGRRFIEGIVDMYKVADRSERDLLHNPRMKTMNKNVFTSHHAYWMAWYTDYNIRGIVAAAQMIKDGSIAAYSMDASGKLVYNEDKDPTWKSEDGKILKKNMVERLIEDGYMNSADEKMPRGYDNKMSSQLKHLADKNIIGNIDDATKGRFGRVTGAKPWMQFASFLPNKLVNYFGSNKYSSVGGKYVVSKNEFGEAETVFEKQMQEGIFVTFKNLHSELRANKYKSMKGWSEMKPHERQNVSKFAMDMINMTVLYALYAGLTGDWDDEEGNQAMVADSRFMKILKYGALDYLVWNPMQFLDTLATIPTLEQAERLSGIFVGDFSGVERSLPLSTTVRAFDEVLSDNKK